MAGADDVVKAALKLIAGGAKEAGPSVAERAAKNIDVFNTANRLGVDTNDIAKLQETKRLMDYHKGFMGDVKERAKSANEIVQQMKASGAFPMEIGTRYTTEHSRRTGQGPWTVTNYYVDPKNPQGSYGYYVRRELPDGGYEESISKIRDPKLEAMHGPEKWEELQRGFIPMTGPKVVKASGGSIREGYGPGGWVDDVVKMAGKVISGEGEDAAKAGIRAYQGSPHNFAAERLVRFPEGRTEYIVGQPDVLPDVPEGAEVLQDFPLGRMRMDKIGTGEGAQAYGHGLYLAEHEGVAKGYKEALSKSGFDIKKMADPYLSYSDEEAVRKLENAAKQAEFNGRKSDATDYRNTARWFAEGRPDQWSAGHVYEVNINADPNSFLDWDKPLSEQPQYIQELLAGHTPLQKNRPYQPTDVGKDIYYKNTQGLGGKDIAAEELTRLGISGIKYLDAGSRYTPANLPNNPIANEARQFLDAAQGNSERALQLFRDSNPVDRWAGPERDEITKVIKAAAKPVTRNYVVFDDSLISIIRKYGIAGASAMLGYNLMEQLDPKQALAASMADQDYQASRPQRSMGGNNSISGALNVARGINGGK